MNDKIFDFSGRETVLAQKSERFVHELLAGGYAGAVLAIFTGGNSGMFFEDTEEILHGIKAGLERNIFDTKIR